MHIFLEALAPNGILPLENSLCVQVLRSPILAASLHGTRAMASAKVCGVVQVIGIVFFSVPCIYFILFFCVLGLHNIDFICSTCIVSGQSALMHF